MPVSSFILMLNASSGPPSGRPGTRGRSACPDQSKPVDYRPRSPGMLATRYTLDRPACGPRPRMRNQPQARPRDPGEHFGYRNLYAEGAWGEISMTAEITDID